MKDLKKLIIIIGIVLLIIILVIVLLNKRKIKEELEQEVPYDYSEAPKEEEPQISFKSYMTVKNCFQAYTDMLNTENSSYFGYNDNNEYTKLVDENKINNNVLDMLSSSYIKKNNISANNVFEYVDKLEEKYLSIITQIYQVDEGKTNVESFAINGYIMPMSNLEESKEVNLIVNIDNMNNTFSIEPLKNSNNLENVIADRIESIENNNNNGFYNSALKEGEVPREYLNLYKYLLLSNPEVAYKYLNEEYREKRFPNISSFKKYVNKAKDMIAKIGIEEYQIIQKEDSNEIEYVCIDGFGNIFIFNEKKLLDYNVILDQYTLELPEFIETYDNSNTQEKVMFNIEKIKQALNSGDYKYVYGKLADNFKNNKFQTEKDLENFMKEKLPNNAKFEYKSFSNEGQTYAYDVIVTDLLDKNSEKINMQFVMKLEDNRDFVMSFSIK